MRGNCPICHKGPWQNRFPKSQKPR